MKLHLPQRTDVGYIERALAENNPAAGGLEVDLDSLRRFDLMGETRLLGLLMIARRAEQPIRVATRFDIDIEQGTSKRLVDLLSTTLGGVLLTQLSDTVVDKSGTDRRHGILARQAEEAVRTGGSFGYGAEKAAPIIDLFGGPPPAAMVAPTVGTEFDPLFRDWVSRMNLGEVEGAQTENVLESLIEFAYEAFDNTRRHGIGDLEKRPLEGARYILLRSVYLDEQIAEQAGDRVGEGPAASYLQRLSKQLPRKVRLIELTVADCGVGIPATLAGSNEIYRGDWDEERQVVENAFLDGVTSRRGRAGAGKGLAKALRSVAELDGMATVRTGRTHLYRDFLENKEWQAERLALIPGTALTLLFPWARIAAPPAQ